MANITVRKHLEEAWPFLKANYRTQNRDTDLNSLVKNCLRAQVHQNANTHRIICVQRFATEFMMKLATTMGISFQMTEAPSVAAQATVCMVPPTKQHRKVGDPCLSIGVFRSLISSDKPADEIVSLVITNGETRDLFPQNAESMPVTVLSNPSRPPSRTSNPNTPLPPIKQTPQGPPKPPTTTNSSGQPNPRAARKQVFRKRKRSESIPTAPSTPMHPTRMLPSTSISNPQFSTATQRPVQGPGPGSDRKPVPKKETTPPEKARLNVSAAQFPDTSLLVSPAPSKDISDINRQTPLKAGCRNLEDLWTEGEATVEDWRRILYAKVYGGSLNEE